MFLSTATVEDNGTFACVAENKAGRAVGRFTLHVVVPMPPKPPQVRVALTITESKKTWRLKETLAISEFYVVMAPEMGLHCRRNSHTPAKM